MTWIIIILKIRIQILGQHTREVSILKLVKNKKKTPVFIIVDKINITATVFFINKIGITSQSTDSDRFNIKPNTIINLSFQFLK